MDALDDLAGMLHERLVREAGRDGRAGGRDGRADTSGSRAGGSDGRAGGSDGLLGDASARIRALVDREAGMLDPGLRDELARRLAQRSFGLGPLEPLLADPDVDEVMVSGPGRVWVERRGRLDRAPVSFGSEAELRHAIERILAPLGRRVDEAEPLCDARLPERTRRLRRL